MPPSLSKKETLLAFLDRGVAMVHLDARRPGVRAPPQFAQEPCLRLNFSYKYGLPDLVIDDAGVSASLSFGGRSFHCVVPWAAVYGMSSQASGAEAVWHEDLPAEVVEQPQPRKPALAAVETDDSAPAEAEEPEAPKPRPHLRLVR